MRTIVYLVIISMFIASCKQTVTTDNELKPCVTVSLPVESYFVNRLCGDAVDINIMVPHSVGHSDYTPLPSQMMLLADSKLYLAIGELDFETTWGERMRNASKSLRWANLSQNIDIIRNQHDDETEHEAHNEKGHHHHSDPHYWLSPRCVRTMVANMAQELKSVLANHAQRIDSALSILNADIDSLDARLTAIGNSRHHSFMIYHPALTYLANDYNMSQYAIEKDGNSPSPQSYKKEIDKAKANGVKIVFVQSGFDRQKAISAAEMLEARVIDFSPESSNWEETMEIIIKAFDNETSGDTHQP